MARYVRGQICGVDNCPSRLWKRVNGQNVCQYGHVNELDVEIDDENEMLNNGSGNGNGTQDFSRRLNNVAGLTISQSARNKVSRLSNDKIQTRKYGEDFKKLKIKCLQIILSKNTKFITLKLNFNEEQRKIYFTIVKLIWIKLLNNHLSNKNSNHNISNNNRNFNIGLVVMINYLGLIQMNYPIYLCDFINLTFDKKFNLEKSEYCLSRNLRIQIPISQLASFHGHLFYNFISKFNDDKFIRQYIKVNCNKNQCQLNYYPLLTRIILNLYLPIDLIKLINNFIEFNNFEFSFNKLIIENHIHPEFELISIIIIFIKIYFLNNSNEFYINWYEKLINNSIKSKINLINPINLRKMIYFNSSFKDLFNWNDDQINIFINFYNKNILPNISSSNIASNNEFKDRNNLQIVKSIKELFDFEDSNNEINDNQLITEYSEFLLSIYKQDGYKTVNKHVNRQENHPYLMETLFQHFTTMYNCTDLQLRDALRNVWRQLNP